MGEAAMPDTEGLASGEWRELNLYHQGRRDNRNCDMVPRLAALMQQLPEALSQVKGATKISFIKAGTSVRPHNGPSNTRLRLHLGIAIPPANAEALIRVGTEWRSWRQGGVLAFDDSFEHEVKFEGPANTADPLLPRIVLIVDIWHPALSDSQIRDSLTLEEEERYVYRLDEA